MSSFFRVPAHKERRPPPVNFRRRPTILSFEGVSKKSKSFDRHFYRGTEGTLSVPDPPRFFEPTRWAGRDDGRRRQEFFMSFEGSPKKPIPSIGILLYFSEKNMRRGGGGRG